MFYDETSSLDQILYDISRITTVVKIKEFAKCWIDSLIGNESIILLTIGPFAKNEGLKFISGIDGCLRNKRI